MKRLGILAIILGIVGAMTYAVLGQPAPSAFPTTLSDVATSPSYKPILARQDGTMLIVTQPGAMISDMEFVGYRRTPAATRGEGQGRCLVIAAPNVTIFHCRFVPGDDDPISTLQGADCTGLLVTNCEFVCDDFGRDNKGPLINRASGPVTFRQCKFTGNATAFRMTGGVHNFEECDFTISTLSGGDIMAGKANFRRCRWHTIPQPKTAPWWYRSIGPCPLRLCGLSGTQQTTSLSECRLYFDGCQLDGKAADGMALCRRFNPNTGYDGPGSVPKSCFRATPN